MGPGLKLEVQSLAGWLARPQRSPGAPATASQAYGKIIAPSGARILPVLSEIAGTGLRAGL